MTAAETSQLQKFLDLWKDSFAAVLGQIGVAAAGAALSVPVDSSSAPAEEIGKSIWGRFVLAGALQGEFMLFAEKPVALQFAQILMSEPLNPEVAFEDQHRDAFAELLRQVAGQVVTFWKQDFGSEIRINFESASVDTFAAALSVELRITGDKISELLLRILLNAELSTQLSAQPVVESPAGVPRAQTIGALPSNLEILLDVELEATIRFGQREMLLRDIFGLMPGAVVELDQFVNEPAEFLVAGRCIAHGEVVVVDGNFGLRVTDVVSPGQRAELIQI